VQGLLLIDKPAGRSSFSLIPALRRLSGEKKIGHAGTLDPFATGLMIYLVGKPYTKRAELFSGQDKEYEMKVRLGLSTDTQDIEGQVIQACDFMPTLEQVQQAIEGFQGLTQQTPPMFSAKKQKGQRLYELARAGKQVERAPCSVHMRIELLSYEYPWLKLKVACSKGTYMRSLAHDLGEVLGTGAHAFELRRTRSGDFSIQDAHSWESVQEAFGPTFLKEL
jgi:tRNA pseudouridine55 synthase